ncbi:MAG: hypothetical protein RJA76_1566 [Bacteroidota bacterium]|jgi:type III pantothenate kinase
MILVIDIGNTDIVLGVHQNGEWIETFRTRTHQPWSAKKVEDWVRSGWSERAYELPEHVILSSVVPGVLPQVQKGIENWLGRKIVVLGSDYYGLLPIQLIAQDEIGTDLIANAVYGFLKYKKNVLVIDFGTALTFTLVNQIGQIEGVSIAPGLKTAVKSLFSQTAQLPEVPLEMPSKPLGVDTVSAIQSGILWGYVGMVKEMIARVKDEKGDDLVVIATGGLSSILTPLKAHFTEVNQHITVEGLRLILEKITNDSQR